MFWGAHPSVTRISDGNYVMRSRIFGNRNAIVRGDEFAFGLVAERRRWRKFGDGNFPDLIPISDGNYVMRSRIFGNRNAIVRGDEFAFGLVAERRRWRKFGDGNFPDLIPISDGNYRCSLFGSGVGNFLVGRDRDFI